MLDINMRLKMLIPIFAALALLAYCGDDKNPEGPQSVPARPDNVRASALTPTSALVQWDDISSNEDEFAVYRAEKGPFAHVGSNPANVSAFLDSLLEDSAFYRYYIIASNAVGSSAPSETVGVTTPAAGLPPTVPRNPSPSDDSIDVPTNQVLTWRCTDPDGDSLFYDIYLGDSAYLNLADTNLTVAAYAPDSLEPGVRYNWKVVARDEARHQTDGPVWHFTTGLASFQIEVEISGNGFVTVEPDLPRFEFGDTVTLTAIPSEGWHFDSWGGDTTGTDTSLVLIMTRDYSIVANFAEGADSTTTRIRGTVTWPGHELSPHVYAFVDSSDQGVPRLVAWTQVEPYEGRFAITIAEQSDTLLVEFSAQDDVDSSGRWDPITPADGYGYYDANGDTIRNDFLKIAPGARLDSVRIVLREYNR